MTATIDKFGRVLIPKKIREAASIKEGMEFELVIEEFTNFILFKPIQKELSRIEYTEWGWPVIIYPDEEKVDFDLKQFTNDGYEERGQKLLGLDD